MKKVLLTSVLFVFLFSACGYFQFQDLPISYDQILVKSNKIEKLYGVDAGQNYESIIFIGLCDDGDIPFFQNHIKVNTKVVPNNPLYEDAATGGFNNPDIYVFPSPAENLAKFGSPVPAGSKAQGYLYISSSIKVIQYADIKGVAFKEELVNGLRYIWEPDAPNPEEANYYVAYPHFMNYQDWAEWFYGTKDNVGINYTLSSVDSIPDYSPLFQWMCFNGVFVIGVSINPDGTYNWTDFPDSITFTSNTFTGTDLLTGAALPLKSFTISKATLQTWVRPNLAPVPPTNI